MCVAKWTQRERKKNIKHTEAHRSPATTCSISANQEQGKETPSDSNVNNDNNKQGVADDVIIDSKSEAKDNSNRDDVIVMSEQPMGGRAGPYENRDDVVQEPLQGSGEERGPRYRPHLLRLVL